MPEPMFAMTADDEDDLPRTIRRERDAREREARERRSAAPAPMLDRRGEPDFALPPANAATVVDFDVPFPKLAMFFVRAVFAAVPALVILLAILWAVGHTLQLFLPQLLKMKILIYMP
jgi:hypothetical protein